MEALKCSKGGSNLRRPVKSHAYSAHRIKLKIYPKSPDHNIHPDMTDILLTGTLNLNTYMYKQTKTATA